MAAMSDCESVALNWLITLQYRTDDDVIAAVEDFSGE